MTNNQRVTALNQLANRGWDKLHEVHLDGIRCWEIWLDRPTGNVDSLIRVIIDATTGVYLKWSIKEQKWMPRIVPLRFVNKLISAELEAAHYNVASDGLVS